MLGLKRGPSSACQMVDETMRWSLLGSCADRPRFGAPFLAGKGDGLNQGVRSKAGESVGTFLCQCCGEEEEAVCGLDALV